MKMAVANMEPSAIIAGSESIPVNNSTEPIPSVAAQCTEQTKPIVSATQSAAFVEPAQATLPDTPKAQTKQMPLFTPAAPISSPWGTCSPIGTGRTGRATPRSAVRKMARQCPSLWLKRRVQDETAFEDDNDAVMSLSLDPFLAQTQAQTQAQPEKLKDGMLTTAADKGDNPTETNTSAEITMPVPERVASSSSSSANAQPAVRRRPPGSGVFRPSHMPGSYCTDFRGTVFRRPELAPVRDPAVFRRTLALATEAGRVTGRVLTRGTSLRSHYGRPNLHHVSR
ncbi:hypothetical protein OC834_007587 [Tilletia horrida]|nr:hypothetical protein OC834_007587 [Tilletia horrida]